MVGNSGFSPVALYPNSLALVLPSEIAPAALQRSTTTSSSSGTKPRYATDPDVVRTPFVLIRSFTP
ncbi:hypothetical protein O4213_19660 [Gordonia rubripertincta]|uniref:Uncharacterized protein n=1 Tax=Gordonia rubripertincta TaxID=36822 RepID=A0ABT4MZU8_GORRU|nr:hypothetical protein [Gordonia rubripertincta]MCZ4552220.1 hypothetical protein [Gordonia rubripertincta]